MYEEMVTRGGFSGPFSYFYHLYPVAGHRELSLASRGFAQPEVASHAALPLKRRLYVSHRIVPGGQPLDVRFPILFNSDVVVSLARPSEADDAYFSNGDGDELWFLHEGQARLESPCGWLDVQAGDYVWIPRSLIHRWHLVGEVRAMIIEFSGGMFVPEIFRNPVGQLRMDAPYTHRDFVTPTGPIATFDHVDDGPRDLFVKKRGHFTHYVAEYPLMDVVGWDGFVYPFAFAIEKYQAKAGLVHLPPTIHTTFEAPGALICSFVPRVVDFHPQAIPCPYPHSSVDCDELILYLRGNFTSRRGVGPGAISLHPAGVAHGPHPGAYEASIGTARTDELAVMIDTLRPLIPTHQSIPLEDEGYHSSWRTS